MRTTLAFALLIALSVPLAAQEADGSGDSGRTVEVNVPGGPSVTIADQSSGSLSLDPERGEVSLSGTTSVTLNDTTLGIGGDLEVSRSAPGAVGSVAPPNSVEAGKVEPVPGGTIAVSPAQLQQDCALAAEFGPETYRCNGRLYRLATGG